MDTVLHEPDNSALSRERDAEPAQSDYSVSHDAQCVDRERGEPGQPVVTLEITGWVVVVAGHLGLKGAVLKAVRCRGKPTGTGGLSIERIAADEDCSALPVASAE